MLEKSQIDNMFSLTTLTTDGIFAGRLTGTIQLVTAGIVIFIVFIGSKFHRQRREGEAPIVSGSLLWGSAKEFSKHAVDFLHRAHREYGDMFTIRLVNQYLTIVMDPHSYENFSRTRTFDFGAIQKQVNLNVFSFIMKEPQRMIKETGRTVRGHFLPPAITSYAENMESAFSSYRTLEKPTRIGVRHFASETIFRAIFSSIFGNLQHPVFNAPRVFHNFERYHQYFNYFWLGMPKCLFPSACTSLEELMQQPSGDELLNDRNSSEYIKTAIRFMQQNGQTEADICGHNLVYLHVNYNTFRLAFWVLCNLLEHPEAMAAVQREVTEELDACCDDGDGVSTIDIQQLEGMKVLDSVIKESVRLSSGVFMVRYVTKDTTFTTQSGQTSVVRAGDRVAIYPPAIHKDPEIFEDPLVYRFDRFVDAKFYKNGAELKHPVMAFGSLCPGQRFALLQLRYFLFSLLAQFRMQPIDGERAEYDVNYHGHEILPPKRDVEFLLSARDRAPPVQLVSH